MGSSSGLIMRVKCWVESRAHRPLFTNVERGPAKLVSLDCFNGQCTAERERMAAIFHELKTWEDDDVPLSTLEVYLLPEGTPVDDFTLIQNDDCLLIRGGVPPPS